MGKLVAAQDSFFLATASAEGQPYMQHRGGPPGFLHALDERTLVFADFAGNRHYISLGNLSENDRAFIFLMDWPSSTRVKFWGRLSVLEDPALLARLSRPDYPGRPERVLRFAIEALDVNCRQHITRRYSEQDVARATDGLRRHIAELETELARLRGQAGGDRD